MDLESVFGIPDSKQTLVAECLHTKTDPFLDFGFSFPTVTVVSAKKAETYSFGHTTSSVATQTQNGISSVSVAAQTQKNDIESDDDFGDFESVPAGTLASSSTQQSAGLSDGHNSSKVSNVPSKSLGTSSNAQVVDDFFADFPIARTSSLPSGSKSMDFTVSSNGGNSTITSMDFFANFNVNSSLPADIFSGNHQTADLKVFESTMSTHKKEVSSDLFADFSSVNEASTLKTKKENGNSEFLSAKSSEDISDDDWGDFVEHSNSGIADGMGGFDWGGNLQLQAQKTVLANKISGNAIYASTNSDPWGNATCIPLHKAESQARSENNLFDGHFVFQDSNFQTQQENKVCSYQKSDASQNNEIMKENAPLQRTLSEQMNKNKRGSLIEISNAPIPLSLFGEEEQEMENSKDEPPLLDTGFQGHSRTKALSIGSLPLGGGNLSDLIASLYKESAQELQRNDVMNEEDKGHIGTTKHDSDMFNLFDTYDMSNQNITVEEYLFDMKMHLFPSSKVSKSMADIQDLLLNSASNDVQISFVGVWAALSSVCASELNHAANVWEQAQNAGVHLNLLSDLKGKRYYAAVGQIYAVALILALTTNVHKPWLSAGKEGEMLKTNLESCKTALLRTTLKDAIRLALSGLEGFLPNSVLSWKDIQDLPTTTKEAYMQSLNVSDDLLSVCRLSLIPFSSFNRLRCVHLDGSQCFLALANLWTNCVSDKLPALPC